MENAEKLFLPLLLLIIGGFFKALYDSVTNNLRIQSEAQQKFKEVRYKAIILLAYALTNYEHEYRKLIQNRTDINSKNDLIEELNAEMINMSLFASDKTIYVMKAFIKNPIGDNFFKLVMEMRKELFGIKTKLTPNDFKL